MTDSLFDAAGEFNVARWVLLSDWGVPALLLVGLACLGVVALAWHNTAELSRARRRALVVLRGLAVLVLLGVFLQPGVRLEHVTRVRNHVVLLLDDSRSMALPGPGRQTRQEAVQAWLQRAAPTLDRWREDHQIDLYAYASHARPIAGPEALTSAGDATRTLTALEEIASRLRPDDLAAVIVVSDGADNGALGDGTRDGEAPGAALSLARRLGAPIHAVFTGPDTPPRDVAIVDVAYDDFAFVRNVVSIEATVTVTGFDALVLPVTLRRGDAVLGTRMLQTRPGETDYRFEFEFVPDKTGKSVFTLEVGHGPGEEILVNNARQFVIRIIRDKIRVLQVVGRPSWDQRFLRQLLKKNPNVDLISFFILRTSASIDVARRDELSLIPFPTQELFEEQLGSFDLIVFQNFTYRGYHMRHYLPLLRNYIAEGGGFIMIGGDLSFASGGYAGTQVAEALPVYLPSDRAGLTTDEAYRPRLTESGRRHPITALSLIPEENQTAWAGLPELVGTNRVVGTTPEANVLLEHPARQAGGAPHPVVAVQTYGSGRVLAVTTDTTWHWAFHPAAADGDARHYYKFWGNAIRWLIQDPALKPVRIEADRDRYPLGAEVTLTARVLGEDYQPAADIEVTVDLTRTPIEADAAARAEIVETLRGRTNEAGELVLRVTPPNDGAYQATARAHLPYGEVPDDDVFVVAPDPIELRETAARKDTLAALARAGGGELRTLDDAPDDLARNEPRVVKVNRRKDVPVWASGYLLLLGVLLPSAEWYLRRRWGLL